MKLKILLPYKTIFEQTVYKITAPGTEGVFQVLPKHLDGTWILKPGVLVICLDADCEDEVYFAIGDGVLIKEGDRLSVSCFQAIEGDSLETLADTVKHDLAVLAESEKKAKEALFKLETDTIKNLIDFNK